jgi:hypothetical protein
MSGVELEVRSGMIWRYQQQPEIAAELSTKLNRFGESSPGGIRTRDLSLERAAS